MHLLIVVSNHHFLIFLIFEAVDGFYLFEFWPTFSCNCFIDIDSQNVAVNPFSFIHCELQGKGRSDGEVRCKRDISFDVL